MKLSKELMAAVRAVCKARRDEFRKKQFNRYEADRQAVRELLAAKPRIARDVRQLRRWRTQAARLNRRALELAAKHGLHADGETLGYDRGAQQRFQAAGGKIRPEPVAPRRAESVIAELAMVSEDRGRVLLQELGIVWI